MFFGLYQIALSATLTHSQPLSPTTIHSHLRPSTLTHPRPLSPIPPIFQKKTTHSHQLSRKVTNPTHFSRKVTHAHPFFKKNSPLPPIFQEKRHTLTHSSTKTIDSHPFLNKNDPFPEFSIKQPTPIQGLYWIALPATLIHSQWLLPTLRHFYPFTPQFSTKTTCFGALSY